MRRIFRMRMAGLCVGSLAVGAALMERGALASWWPLLAANALIWPPVAYQLAKRAAEPLSFERINLVVDSMLGGMWIALMHFKVMPSTLLLVTLAMDKLAFGGGRFLLQALGFQIAACLATAFFTGFSTEFASSVTTELACLPHAVIYPLVVSSTAYRLLRTVHRQHEELLQLNRIDSLTGLVNRGYWQESGVHALKRFHRGWPASSLLFIDIDHFKLVNDVYGHHAGDRVLAAFARIIRENIRDIDTGGRYAGDEFVVILADTPQAAALPIAERLLLQFRNIASELDLDASCTASIGIAEVDDSIKEISGWTSKADAALYRAKRAGRNCVAC